MWTRGFDLTGRIPVSAGRFLSCVNTNRTLAHGMLESGSRPEQVWTRPNLHHRVATRPLFPSISPYLSVFLSISMFHQMTPEVSLAHLVKLSMRGWSLFGLNINYHINEGLICLIPGVTQDILNSSHHVIYGCT